MRTEERSARFIIPNQYSVYSTLNNGWKLWYGLYVRRYNFQTVFQFYHRKNHLV